MPSQLILGNELTRVVLHTIDTQNENKQVANEQKAIALGKLVHPDLSVKEQKVKGKQYLYETSVLDETPHVLRLIMERKKLYVSILDIRKALKEYGTDQVPVDRLSLLDIDQIQCFINKDVKVEEVNHEDITQKETWVLEGSIHASDEDIAESFNLDD